MKTLEKKAHRLAQWIMRRERPITVELLSRMILFKLNEQHHTDIQNACEAYCKKVCKEHGESCAWRTHGVRCGILASFVKAMEGEE